MKKAIGLFIFTMLTLCSCGWQLRGSQANHSTEPMKLSLSASDIYTSLYRTFKITYEKNRVELTSSSNAPQLRLLNEVISVRTVSLNTELDPAEDKMTLLVHYQLTLENKPAQIYKVQTEKTLIRNKNRAAAREDEKEKLLQEMRVELAERILNQIQAASNNGANETR